MAGTLVSALFLFAIAAANVARADLDLPRLHDGQERRRFVEEDLDLVLANRGLLGAAVPPLLPRRRRRAGKCIRSACCSASASTPRPKSACSAFRRRQAAQGLSIWSILVFPALFTAGMTLLDTTDSVLMLGAYGWAFVKPIRKLYYNLTITAASVVVALVVGGLETLNLIGDQLGLTDGGGFWGAIGALNDNFGVLGYLIVGIFASPGWCRSSSIASSATTTSKPSRPERLSGVQPRYDLRCG